MKPLIILILFAGSLHLLCQSYSDTTYNVELTLTPSPLFSFFKYERYPGATDYQKLGAGLITRCMWHPGRLLSVGIMTGYVFISSDKVKEGKGTSISKLSAIPLQIAVAMQRSSLEIGVGVGSYLMLTSIDNGNVAHSIRNEVALSLFGSYFFPINDDFSIGPELKGAFILYRGIFSIMPSVNIRYNLWRY